MEAPLATPRIVMIIGKRSLANGVAESDDEAPSWFERTGTVEALLVVENMRRKPFYVPISFMPTK